MKIKIVQVGKTKREYEDLEAEFLKMLKAFCEVETVTVKELSGDTRALEGGYLVVLDEGGREVTSVEFAEVLKGCEAHGRITFVIGGAFGLDEAVREKADLVLSLSRMTFTHQMVRVFLLEQIYRGFCIMKGRDYHH